MKRYEEYKDTGVKWIPKIPKHWNIEPFGRHFTYGKGLPITKVDLIQEGIPVISYGQIHSKLNRGTTISDELVRYVSPMYLSSNPNSLLKSGDFIFADTSEDIEGSGNFAYNDYETNLFAGYHTLIARPIDLVNTNYLAYLFLSKPWKNQVQSLVNGVKVYSISKRHLKKSILLFPPLTEQEKIVRFLESKTLCIDAYVAERERELQLLNELKESEIANIITRGLNPDVKMKDSGIPWIGMIPEHWEVKRIASLFTGKVATNSDFEYQHAYKFNYGTLVPKDEVGDIEEYRATYVKYSIIKKGDILINGLNLNYDFVSQRVAIAPNDGIITSAYIVARPRLNTNSEYYNYLFKTMDNKKLFHGMGTGIRLTLSFDELKKQLIPVPTPEEQRDIVAYIEEKCKKVNSLIDELNAEIEYLKEYKQKLIADCVTGQINVQSEI